MVTCRHRMDSRPFSNSALITRLMTHTYTKRVWKVYCLVKEAGLWGSRQGDWLEFFCSQIWGFPCEVRGLCALNLPVSTKMKHPVCLFGLFRSFRVQGKWEGWGLMAVSCHEVESDSSLHYIFSSVSTHVDRFMFKHYTQLSIHQVHTHPYTDLHIATVFLINNYVSMCRPTSFFYVDVDFHCSADVYN